LGVVFLWILITGVTFTAEEAISIVYIVATAFRILSRDTIVLRFIFLSVIALMKQFKQFIDHFKTLKVLK